MVGMGLPLVPVLEVEACLSPSTGPAHAQRFVNEGTGQSSMGSLALGGVGCSWTLHRSLLTDRPSTDGVWSEPLPKECSTAVWGSTKVPRQRANVPTLSC